MKKETRLEVIDEMLGALQPCGETNFDRTVKENIKIAGIVLDKILNNFACNAEYDGYEGSCWDIREQSVSLLENVWNTSFQFLHKIEEEKERLRRETGEFDWM